VIQKPQQPRRRAAQAPRSGSDNENSGTIILDGTRLIAHRKTLGWSQAMLASQSGVSEDTISRAENGRPLRLGLANTIASTFKVELQSLLNRDEVAYASAADEAHVQGSAPRGDLIALGPEIVAVGDMLAFDGASWDILLRHFVIGDVTALIAYVDGFTNTRHGDRYVLVNAIGDGRELTTAPAVTRTETGYKVHCPVAPAFPRTAAQQLGSQWAISSKTNDIYAENREFARVSGLDSLPQVVTSCLSMRRGESPIYPDYGSRLAEYYDAFHSSPWLGDLLKLEAVRQAAMPYHNEVMKLHHTPLQCVEQVVSVDVLVEAPEGKRLPIKVVFKVKGIGRWERELSILMPPNDRSVTSASQLGWGERPGADAEHRRQDEQQAKATPERPQPPVIPGSPKPAISDRIKRLGLEQAVSEGRWPYRWELPPGGD
jgi:DNA-binding XRE family transcriptional regulator/phage baseplate assembly protein W